MKTREHGNSEIPSRILVRGTNWLGDAIMSLPALARLKERFPASSISILTESKLAELWRHFPVIDSVLKFNRGDSVWSVAGQLRAERFDVGIAFPNSWRSAAELCFARIPRRVGYKNEGRGILLTEAISRSSPNRGATRKRSIREIHRLTSDLDPLPHSKASQALHHTHEYLRLVAHLGSESAPIGVRLAIPNSERQAFLNRCGLSHAKSAVILGLIPGAEYGSAKRWPAESFITAARQIGGFTRCQWILFGGTNDVPVAREVENGLKRLQTSASPNSSASRVPTVLNMAGSTSLSELLAGLSLCKLVITNDTGPMHAAAAVGTPVVAIFGSTSPELTSPGQMGSDAVRILRSDAPCAPCFRRTCPIDFRCMNRIDAGSVAKAAIEIVQQSSEREC